MIHFARVRIQGSCPRCRDGGDMEVCMADNGSYAECVYCHPHYTMTTEQARDKIVAALTDHRDKPRPVKKKVVKKKVAATHPVKKKKKAPFEATCPDKRPTKKKKKVRNVV